MLELGIYGGTFAPVHNGHIAAARAFYTQARLDRLLIVPTLIPPHKQLTFKDDPTDRLNMLKLAFENEIGYGDTLVISDHELKSPPPSYTVNTLEHFSSPDTHITFLCGTDMFLTLDSWRSPDRIFALATVAVMLRESHADDALLATVRECTERYTRKYGADILMIKSPPVEISSSDIRSGDDSLKRRFLPPSVYEYVTRRHLYEDQR